jgi:hypothetical protein
VTPGWRQGLVVAFVAAALAAAVVMFSHPPHATIAVMRASSPAAGH